MYVYSCYALPRLDDQVKTRNFSPARGGGIIEDLPTSWPPKFSTEQNVTEC